MFDGAALGLGKAAEVHEAGHVDADEQVRLDVEDPVEFQGAHFSGDVREGHGKGAAEATALLCLTEGDDLRILNGGEQGADRLASASASATGVVGAVEGKSRGLVEFLGPGFDAHAVENEVHHLPGPLGERVDGEVRFLRIGGDFCGNS